MKFDVSSLSLDPFTYRMRIALGFGNINDFGCDGVNYGEIEDYNVRFQ